MTNDATLSERHLSFTAMAIPQLEATQAVERILSRIAPNRYRRSSGPINLAAIYDVEPPRGGAHLHRLVIYSPLQVPSFCVLVTNLWDGWSSLSYLLAKEHGRFQVQVKSTRRQVE